MNSPCVCVFIFPCVKCLSWPSPRPGFWPRLGLVQIMSCLGVRAGRPGGDTEFPFLFPLEPRTFKAKELWEKSGAVIMAVRRPGCFLCREVGALEDQFREKNPGKWAPEHCQPGPKACRSTSAFCQHWAVLLFALDISFDIDFIPAF